MMQKRTQNNRMIMPCGVVVIIAIAILLCLKIYAGYKRGDNEKHFLFGATYMTMNNAFYQMLNRELKTNIEEHGDRLMTLDPALDQKKQIEQIKYLIDEKVDAIFLNPVDWREIEEGLIEAQKAGIPIIVVDSQVYNTQLVSATVISDNYLAGVLCAKDMMKKKDSARIMLLTHKQAYSAVQRVQGFLDTIKSHPEYYVVASADTQGQIERTLPKVQEALKKYEVIDVIFGLNDPSAIGALAALDSCQYSEDVLVYGVDGSPDAKKLISEGMLTASVAQFPTALAKTALDTAYDVISGRELEKNDIVIGVELINKHNVLNYNIGRWQ